MARQQDWSERPGGSDEDDGDHCLDGPSSFSHIGSDRTWSSPACWHAFVRLVSLFLRALGVNSGSIPVDSYSDGEPARPLRGRWPALIITRSSNRVSGFSGREMYLRFRRSIRWLSHVFSVSTCFLCHFEPSSREREHRRQGGIAQEVDR